MTADVGHRHVTAGGLRMHVAERGEGPLVLLLHGWPESWYSWRHQFEQLAAAGYHVVAPDQRGYGGTDRPAGVDAYTLLHLVGDVVALVRELGYDRAVLVGHDWGAIVAWVAAMLRPDVVRGVAGLSVPPILPAGMPSLPRSRELYGPGFYQNRLIEPGTDAELAADPAATVRRVIGRGTGTGPPRPWVVPDGMTLLDSVPEPDTLPAWLTADDVAAFAADHARHGAHAFTGPLNWYRNIERNAELLAAFDGRTVDVPGLYVVGDRDMVTSLHGHDEVLRNLPAIVPGLPGVVTLPGCGHWTQQERPAEVNDALVGFLGALDG